MAVQLLEMAQIKLLSPSSNVLPDILAIARLEPSLEKLS
jgi:hypothetical protein